GYVSVTTQRFEYPNFVSMIERHLLDWTGARWRLSRKLYDGLGRPTAHTVALDGQTLPDPDKPAAAENHFYFYDNRGNLNQTTDPHPDATASNQTSVTHTFRYDVRGRVIEVRAPHEANDADVPFATMSYAPWEKTVTDVDGSVNHQVNDGLGLLRQVDEYGPTTPAAEVAHTFYDYDAAGRLSRMRDADGHDTTLTHDGA